MTPPRHQLPLRAADVLEEIRAWQRDRGHAPTVSQLGLIFQRNNDCIKSHLRRLRKAGAIDYHPQGRPQIVLHTRTTGPAT